MEYQTNDMCSMLKEDTGVKVSPRKLALLAAAVIAAASAGAYVYENRTVLTCDEYTIKEYQDLLGRVSNSKYKSAMEAERTGGTLSSSWIWIQEQEQALYDRVLDSLIDCGATGNMLTPTYFPPEL